MWIRTPLKNNVNLSKVDYVSYKKAPASALWQLYSTAEIKQRGINDEDQCYIAYVLLGKTEVAVDVLFTKQEAEEVVENVTNLISEGQIVDWVRKPASIL